MDKKITAEWARTTSDTVLSEMVETQIIQCERAIKVAVNANEMEVSTNMFALPKTKSELEGRGFKVKQFSDQRDGDSLKISW